MSSLRWKLLMAYLPGVATVVSSFDSPEVQKLVFETLVVALDEKTLAEEGIAVSDRVEEAPKREKSQGKRDKGSRSRPEASVEAAVPSNQSLAVDVVDGASIHEFLGQ